MGFVKCGVAFVLVVAFMASFSVSYTNPFDGKPLSLLGSCFFISFGFVLCCF